jgi:tRNA(Ile)-lysidine synthase
MRRARPERALEQAVAEKVAASRGETLLAAVSGGPDSTALAALLAEHAARAEANLVVAHVNHASRASAARDEGVVLALATLLGVRVVVRALVPGSSSEARLRSARYAQLADLARDLGVRRVLTAHHAEDQTETVLMALFRGTGPAGLAGMPETRRLAGGVTLVRPLLGTTHAELVAYCRSRRLPFALDPSNDDLAYRRNALRAALAQLRRSFPGLDAAVARSAAIARDDLTGDERGSLRRRLREELIAATGQVRDMSYERLDAVARALQRRRAGRHFVRPGLEVITPSSLASRGPQD